jgi:hypothetical protein
MADICHLHLSRHASPVTAARSDLQVAPEYLNSESREDKWTPDDGLGGSVNDVAESIKAEEWILCMKGTLKLHISSDILVEFHCLKIFLRYSFF